VKVNQATHPVGVMCRLLQISRSGFYAWLDRPMSERDRSDLALTGKIEAIHRRSRGVYGSPNIHAELADDYGIRVGRKRVARLASPGTLLPRDRAREPSSRVARSIYARI
jgi:putative transposase